MSFAKYIINFSINQRFLLLSFTCAIFISIYYEVCYILTKTLRRMLLVMLNFDDHWMDRCALKFMFSHRLA